MYAIVRTGGKQYRVEEGASLSVERLPAPEGDTVELTDVLMIADNGNVTVGTPVIEGARVVAEVEAHGRAKKIVVFKYKAKVRARKKTGHRQHFTRLAVREILAPGQQSKVEKPKRRRAAAAAAAAEAEPEAEAQLEAPPAEAVEAPKPRRRAPARKTAPATAAAAEKKPATRSRKAAASKAAPKRKAAAPKASAEKPKRRAPARKKKDEE